MGADSGFVRFARIKEIPLAHTNRVRIAGFPYGNRVVKFRLVRSNLADLSNAKNA
jgi:hypothetical protein